MIPNLTMIVAAYVIFRVVEVLMKMDCEGEHGKLGWVGQFILMVLATGVIVIAVACTWMTIQAGAGAEALLTSLPETLGW